MLRFACFFAYISAGSWDLRTPSLVLRSRADNLPTPEVSGNAGKVSAARLKVSGSPRSVSEVLLEVSGRPENPRTRPGILRRRPEISGRVLGFP